jgi:hypothetical protein
MHSSTTIKAPLFNFVDIAEGFDNTDDYGNPEKPCASPTLKDIRSQRNLRDKCNILLGLDTLCNRQFREQGACSHELEVVLRPNEEDNRGDGSWKWEGEVLFPYRMDVYGHLGKLMNLRWMNEEHQYGYESYQSDK